MDIAIAQINARLGDIDFNLKKAADDCHKAFQDGNDIICFPELFTIGYSPNDLLERPELIDKQTTYLERFSKNIPKGLTVLMGCVEKRDGQLYNSCALIKKNKIVKYFNKELLPNYDVFDESRHFEKGSLKNNFFKHKGLNVLVCICEDLWFSSTSKYPTNPLDKLKKKPDHIISLNASPFEIGKQKRRERLISNISKRFDCGVTYVNLVGAQDELVFDGGSFQTNKKGDTTTRLPSFTEHLHKGGKSLKKPILSKYASIEQSLILGIKDYFKKTGFKKAHFGLSGGIDSALVAYLATKALGSQNVTAIAMPGPYSTKLSFSLAKKLSKNLGISFESFDINGIYEQFINTFEDSFESTDFGLIHENAQARLRAIALMAFSNKEGSLLLATSNKSELCVGYSTLYGDQCGALMPIGDLLKSEVFDLCKWLNKRDRAETIPDKIISRPPSAELRPNQKDSDSLPDYKILDKSIHKMISLKQPPKSDLDRWVLSRSYMSEFKRWQSAPILKVSEHAFGIGRRMPIAHNFKY